MKIVLRNFPNGRRTEIVPVASFVPEQQYAVRTYNGHSRVNYPDKPISQTEMLALLIEAGEETFVEDLLCEEDFAYVKRHYYSSKSYAHPSCLRA